MHFLFFTRYLVLGTRYCFLREKATGCMSRVLTIGSSDKCYPDIYGTNISFSGLNRYKLLPKGYKLWLVLNNYPLGRKLLERCTEHLYKYTRLSYTYTKLSGKSTGVPCTSRYCGRGIPDFPGLIRNTRRVIRDILKAIRNFSGAIRDFCRGIRIKG